MCIHHRNAKHDAPKNATPKYLRNTIIIIIIKHFPKLCDLK